MTPVTKHVLAIVPGGLYAGAEMVLLRDLEAARARGWHVRVACADGPLLERLDAANIPRVPIADLRLPSGPTPVALARLAGRIGRAALRLRSTVRPGELLLANGINALPALRLARTLGLTNTTVWLAHDVLVRGDRLRLLRAAAPGVDHAIAVSEATAAPLRVVGIPTTVVWNGTAWPVDPAPVPPPAPPVIGLAAVLTEHKGQLVLLDALARMRHREAVVELLGGVLPKDGSFARRVQARAHRPDVAGRVRFLGHRSDPLERMRSWTISVSASTDPEAGPLTVLESMSVGVPFVGTAHGGVLEVLGDAGLVVEPRDPGALAAALDLLLDDANLAERCRTAGPRLIAERNLTIDAHQQGVVDELERILSA